MSDNLMGLLVVVVIGIVVVGVVVYKVLQFMKGSIRISLPQTAFRNGEAITGSLELTTRQAVEGQRLVVALSGRRVTRSYRNGRSQTKTQEVYRDERPLEGPRAYGAGESARYEFTLPVPAREKTLGLEGPLGDILKVGLELANSANSSMRWRLEARLEAKGVDLDAGKDISIIS